MRRYFASLFDWQSTYDWKNSVVDLLTVLGMDPRPCARKQLAKDLGFSGDCDNEMMLNNWLHQELTQKLVANGAVHFC